MVQPPLGQSVSSRTAAGGATALVTMPSAVRSLLFAALAGLVLALSTTGPAAAATPCWKAVIDDWFADGRIDHTYAPSCYSQALHHVPQDVGDYSSAKSDIFRARIAAIRRDRQPLMSTETNPTGTVNTTTTGVVPKAIQKLGPSNAASVPLPLVILGGVALLLLAAACVSFVNRRLQQRRPPPPGA
jgi:hypothetical protein